MNTLSPVREQEGRAGRREKEGRRKEKGRMRSFLGNAVVTRFPGGVAMSLLFMEETLWGSVPPRPAAQLARHLLPH